eukprot:gene17276-20558_t
MKKWKFHRPCASNDGDFTQRTVFIPSLIRVVISRRADTTNDEEESRAVQRCIEAHCEPVVLSRGKMVADTSCKELRLQMLWRLNNCREREDSFADGGVRVAAVVVPAAERR